MATSLAMMAARRWGAPDTASGKTASSSGVRSHGGNEAMMMKSTILLVIALAAGTGHADDAKPSDAANEAKEAPKDASGAAAEVKVGTGVDKHEIAGEAASFPAGTTVWVWSCGRRPCRSARSGGRPSRAARLPRPATGRSTSRPRPARRSARCRSPSSSCDPVATSGRPGPWPTPRRTNVRIPDTRCGHSPPVGPPSTSIVPPLK
jgi:hypothetical protein